MKFINNSLLETIYQNNFKSDKVIFQVVLHGHPFLMAPGNNSQFKLLNIRLIIKSANTRNNHIGIN